MKQLHLPELEAINRITNIPIVETGWNYAGNIYNRIKQSNNLIYWTFDQAESSLYTVIDTASPAVFLLEGPLSTIDKLICKSLDMVEQRVPSINLPPQMIYFNTKKYVNDVGHKIAKPMLKRADSVKQIGNSVLSSKYTAFAADKLDGALNVADKYVDKYLPADAFDNQSTDEVDSPIEGPGGKALHTSQHMYRFSKKLKRRLTRRTLLEAKALKDHSVEAIHVLVYVAELIATDPKLALQKGRELWVSLSKDEPENQARPDNLEQLIVMLSRESARRIVHLVNFTTSGFGKVPRKITGLIANLTNTCVQLLDSIIKTLHLDGVQQVIWTQAQTHAQILTLYLKQLNINTTDLLEQLVLMLSGQDHTKTSIPTSSTPIVNSTPIPPPPPPAPTQTTKNKTQNYQFKQTTPVVQQDSLRPPAATRPQLKATNRHTINVSNGESAIKP